VFGKKNKKALQISVVNHPKTDEGAVCEESKKVIDPETVRNIAEQGKEFAKKLALIAIGTYAAIKAIDTASQVIVNKTKNGKED